MVEIVVSGKEYQLSEKQFKELFIELSTIRKKVAKDLVDISDQIALLDNISFLALKRLISFKLLELQLNVSELFNVIYDLVITNDEIKKLDVSAYEKHDLTIDLSHKFLEVKLNKNYNKLINFIIKQANKYHYDPEFIIVLYYFRKDIAQKLKQKKSLWSFLVKNKTQSITEDMVLILLKLGYNLNEALKISASASGGFFHLISQQLIEAGADPNIALEIVVARGDIQFLQLLANYNIDVNKKDKNGDNLLMLAVDRGDAIILSLLLAKQAKINEVNNDKETALIKACKRDDALIAAMLLQKGADINIMDNQGLNAFFYAVEKGDKVLITMLLKRQADYKSITAYFKQGMREKRIYFIEILIEVINLTKEQYLEIIAQNIIAQDLHAKYLREYDIAKSNLAEINNFHGIITPDSREKNLVKNNFKKQAKFIEVILENNPEMIKEMISDDDISLSITNFSALNHTDLVHLIAFNNQIEIMHMFMARHIDVNRPDAEGNTPIFLALINRNIELFKLLLQHNANLYQTNNHGISSYDLIVVNNLTEFADIIATKNG
ncbi:MAG: ankyrin repeat domain-containing protein [Rickettsiales bacterium]